ncbi:hypothetical protein ACVW00_003260 [Marmoricola sp. URHA0025 HA25]
MPTSLTAGAAAAANQLRSRLREVSAPPRTSSIGESGACVDLFLAATCKHVMALESVLVASAKREVADTEWRELSGACHRLQLALRTMHARRRGSAQFVRIPWAGIRRDVAECLEALLAAEGSAIARLEAVLPEDHAARIADRLAQAELRAPTRPHPHLPRRGLQGRIARRAASRADAFWDGVQGRVVVARARVA